GRVVLEVTAVQGERVRTRVLVGGPVSDHKGLNLPGVKVSVPALTSKDADDLRWALALRADMIALSFVQGPDDAAPPRKIMDEMGVRLPLIAKVEKPQAVAALDEVIATFDGIMVARGDLGVEYPLEQVPLVQKRAIKLARQAAKPVIVATQMLESMISAPRPTRAEASDVANAVLDGADALMLSAETSVGAYPVDAVATMARIIEAAEHDWPFSPPASAPETTGAAIARAAGEVGAAVGARALVAFTMTGETAVLLVRGEAGEAEQGQRLVARALGGQEVAVVAAAVPVDQLHPPPGEALEGVGLRRIDDVLDDAGDHDGRLARPARPGHLR